MSLSTELIAGATTALYFAFVFGVVAFLRWRRKSRWPFKKEDRLLRVAGEGLRKAIVELDEKFTLEALAGIAVSTLLAAGASKVAWAMQLGPRWAAYSPFLILFASFSYSALRIGRMWQRRQNLLLGWFGERMVGERLDEARTDGWRIFHDVPFVNDGVAFNIDHVAIGVGGIFVFETKARRKGKALPGRRDSVVQFDGQKLRWPWGDDDHGLAQAERNALFLASWIKAEIGERVHASPFLVIPGWWVDLLPSRNPRLCRVLNDKWIGGVLKPSTATLSPKQVDLISLRLEAACRNVED